MPAEEPTASEGRSLPTLEWKRRRGPSWRVPLGVGIVLIVALLTVAATDRSGAARPSPRAAPAFSAPLLGGGQLSTASLRGRPAVLDFWASWCPACRTELHAIQQVAATGRALVAGIDVRDRAGDATRTMRAASATYPVAADPNGRVAGDFAVVGIPTVVVLDRCSQVVHRFLGPVSAARVEAALAAARSCPS